MPSFDFSSGFTREQLEKLARELDIDSKTYHAFKNTYNSRKSATEVPYESMKHQQQSKPGTPNFSNVRISSRVTSLLKDQTCDLCKCDLSTHKVIHNFLYKKYFQWITTCRHCYVNNNMPEGQTFTRPTTKDLFTLS